MQLKTMKQLISVLGVFFFLSLVLIFYNLRLGLLLTAVAILGLSPLLWNVWKLMHTKEGLEALEALDKGRNEISLEDVPPRLIALLIAVLIISYLGFFGIFRFNPFIDLSLSILTVLLLAYYFLRKRRIQKQKSARNS
jgi:hypothetical protein